MQPNNRILHSTNQASTVLAYKTSQVRIGQVTKHTLVLSMALKTSKFFCDTMFEIFYYIKHQFSRFHGFHHRRSFPRLNSKKLKLCTNGILNHVCSTNTYDATHIKTNAPNTRTSRLLLTHSQQTISFCSQDFIIHSTVYNALAIAFIRDQDFCLRALDFTIDSKSYGDHQRQQHTMLSQ